MCVVATWEPAVHAQATDDTILDARDALGRKDAERLAADRALVLAGQHPLAMWVDYWELKNRLETAAQTDLDAFYARWPGTYVEDRLRNDWLLELGKRRDWANFVVEYPRFRMNDDREVTCYALLNEHFAGRDVHDAALAAWFAQRDSDDGCNLMAATLAEAKVFDSADIWRKVRLSMSATRSRAARQAAALFSPATESLVEDLADKPARFLTRKARHGTRTDDELATLALIRMADHDPEAAALALKDRWQRRLPPDLAAWAWATVARESAIKLQPEAADHYQTAARIFAKDGNRALDWPADTMAWKARAALRADNGKGRWAQVLQAIDAMRPEDQRDTVWVYWKARALQELAPKSRDRDAMQAHARALFTSIAGPLDFYGALAAEALGQPAALPPAPAPLSVDERATAAINPGLVRGLHLATIGLRDEGRREWNFTLRGMDDRHLLAAAAMACDVEDWQLCINTSERTRSEIDISQRYPVPYRAAIAARSQELGLDPNYVQGLIRQETRFMPMLRSSAGASGLMQVMPATAKWVAKKIGIDYSPSMIGDPDVNLQLGTGYLKLVLDAFDGSQAMAAAAYNAGPNRPRRWRDGPQLATAAWTENIPFSETRNYVKKVLSNASIYAALADGKTPTLRARLERTIGPREADEPSANADLP
jgi:soluble lytic murein transglycosylase